MISGGKITIWIIMKSQNFIETLNIKEQILIEWVTNSFFQKKFEKYCNRLNR